MGQVLINGVSYGSGRNVQTISNNGNTKVVIDGRTVGNFTDQQVDIVVQGNIESLDCTSCVVNGNISGDVDATNVTCGDIGGNVEATNVKAKVITGRVNAVNVTIK
jgi:hypothetical protein